jgi:hypothetical protein
MVEGRPAVVRLPEAVLLAFFRPVSSLIDPTASAVLAANVKTVVVRGPAGELRLQRDLERWRAPELGVEVPGRVAEALLEQVTVRRAARIEVGQFPSELQVATVTMIGFDGLPLDTVRIARDAETGGWGLDNGDNVMRIFGAETQIPLTPADFGLTDQVTP